MVFEQLKIKGATSGNVLEVTAANACKVDGSAVTQPISGTVTINAIPAGTNNIGDVDVLTVPSDPFGVNADAASATGSISAKLRFIASTGIPITGTVTVASHDVTNTGTFATQITGAALTSLQLIDDAVYVLGTDTYTEATSKGIVIGAVRRDADTTLVNTTNEFGPLQMDANGRLKVEVFSGEALPVTMTSTTITGTVAVTQSGTWNIGSITTLPALAAGTNNIGDVDVLTVPADPFGANADAIVAAGATGSISAKLRRISQGLEDLKTGITALPSHAVTNTGTFAVQVDGAALTALQLLDDTIFVDDAVFTPGTSKITSIGLIADETATDSVDEGDIGAPRMTLDRKQITAVYAHTTGGWTPYVLISAASTNATSVKGSAGQVGSIVAFNLNASPAYLKLYNKATAPTVGTDTPVQVYMIPGNTSGAGFVIPPTPGLDFTTGIAFALTTGIAHTNNVGVAANEVIVNLGYK